MHDLLSTAEVAEVLQTSERMVHYYVRDGRLTPAKKIGRSYLFTPKSVAELKPKLVRYNWSRQLAAATSDAGHLDVDRALMIVGAFALGVVAALSPLAVTVYVALIAVCTFAASWLVVHELRERGRLRDRVIDECVSPDSLIVLDDYGRRRVDVELLDHVIVHGPFSRIGTRK